MFFKLRIGGFVLLPLSVLLMSCLTCLRTSRADEPSLAIRLQGGQTAVYPVSEIERVLFEDSTLVVISSLGEDSYGAKEVERIDFLWNPQNSSSPEELLQTLKAVHLFQNQPNPFGPKTKVSFDLPNTGMVDLQIYGPSGRHIRTLLSEAMDAGRHVVDWDGRDANGIRVPGGVYFYQLRAPGVEESRRMIVLP